MIHGIEMMSLV